MAFPLSDYYGGSVAIGFSPRRRSQVFLVIDVIARVRCLVRYLEWDRFPPLIRQEFSATNTIWSYPDVSAVSVLSEGPTLDRWQLRFRQFSFHHTGQVLQDQHPKRFRVSPALPECYF